MHTSEINALAPMTASYLARKGVTLTHPRAIALADSVAHGMLDSVNELHAIAKEAGDNRLARLAGWMGDLCFRGAFDPLQPMGDREWEAVESALWQIDANAEVLGTWFTEEV